MNITFYGQSGFGIETGNKKLVLDPFISGNPAAEGKVKADDVEAKQKFRDAGKELILMEVGESQEIELW